MIIDKFSLPFTVTSNDVGPSRTLKPVSVMRYIQEVAGVHLKESGLSYEFMKENGIVFLIVKIAVKTIRHPVCGENLKVETWFEKLKGAKFLRDICIYDSDNKPVIISKSLWVAANPATHRIVRPRDYPFEIPEQSDSTVDVDYEDIDNKELPDFSACKEVLWSDIDYNYHMNNSIYASIICDYFPNGLGDKKIDFFEIDFEGEAKLCNKIDIKGYNYNDSVVSYFGTIGGSKCFKALAVVKQEDKSN